MIHLILLSTVAAEVVGGGLCSPAYRDREAATQALARWWPLLPHALSFPARPPRWDPEAAERAGFALRRAARLALYLDTPDGRLAFAALTRKRTMEADEHFAHGPVRPGCKNFLEAARVLARPASWHYLSAIVRLYDVPQTYSAYDYGDGTSGYEYQTQYTWDYLIEGRYRPASWATLGDFNPPHGSAAWAFSPLRDWMLPTANRRLREHLGIQVGPRGDE